MCLFCLLKHVSRTLLYLYFFRVSSNMHKTIITNAQLSEKAAESSFLGKSSKYKQPSRFAISSKFKKGRKPTATLGVYAQRMGSAECSVQTRNVLALQNQKWRLYYVQRDEQSTTSKNCQGQCSKHLSNQHIWPKWFILSTNQIPVTKRLPKYQHWERDVPLSSTCVISHPPGSGRCCWKCLELWTWATAWPSVDVDWGPLVVACWPKELRELGRDATRPLVTSGELGGGGVGGLSSPPRGEF